MSTEVAWIEASVDVDGYRVHVAKAGTGPRLVWVDPALGSSAMRPLQGAIDVLTRDFEVVTYDRRGRGRNAPGASSVDHEVGDLAAVIDHVGCAAAVVGFSSGAAVALRAAPRLQHSTLILLEPATDETRDDTGLRERLTAAIDAGDDESAVRMFYEATGVPDDIVQQIVTSESWPAVVRGAATLPTEIDVAVVDDTMISQVRAPVHLIVSDGSPDEITGMSARLAERLGAPSWSEPGGWHGVEPDALRSRVLAILGGSTRP